MATHAYPVASPYTGAATLTDAIGTSSPAIFAATIAEALSFVVTTTGDSGPGSLRQAILDADSVGGHAITFAIPAAGVATVVVTSPLPAITGPTIIDGPSEAGFEGLLPPYPLVEVDGQEANSAVTDGLSFVPGSAGSLVLGVSIYGFGGSQVLIGAPDVTLFGDEVGLRATGAFPDPPFGHPSPVGAPDDGVEVVAPGAIIGGPFPGEGNAISGNAGWGLLLAGPSAVLAQVIGNRIGLDPTGQAARGNGLDGVAALGGAGHEFLGPGNAISGNSGNGILLLGSSADLVVGNAIGTDFAGSREIANGNDGISIDGASSSILIGGMGPLSGNLISGNGTLGVAVMGGSNGVVLESDRIGTDRSGERALGNGIAGVLLHDSPGNVVGPGDLVSGNGRALQGAGIWIDGPGSTSDLVSGDEVGTDLSGEFALGNAVIGVLIDQASGDVIGGGAFGLPNLISGNTSIGVMIAGPIASGNLVVGNRIGTDASGTRAVGNGSSTQGAGVYVDNASGNAIGTASAGSGNLISGNGFDGVQVFGPSSGGNLIEGNGIGTDRSGTIRLGNGEDGLLINGAPTTRVVGNLVAANGLDGITVSGPGASRTLIEANAIGRGLGGQLLGNAAFGILVINAAPSPILANNINVNNTDGPVRDTTLASASASASASPSTAAAASTKGQAVAVAHARAKPSGPRPSSKAKGSPLKSPAKG